MAEAITKGSSRPALWRLLRVIPVNFAGAQCSNSNMLWPGCALATGLCNGLNALLHSAFQVIVKSDTFIHAVQKMQRALYEFQIRGVKTNISFLEKVLRHEEFLSGSATTSFIDRRATDTALDPAPYLSLVLPFNCCLSHTVADYAAHTWSELLGCVMGE